MLLAHEVLHSFKTKKGLERWIALKLDMVKAYDCFERNVIFTRFEKLGFYSRWISWLKQCVTTISFSLLVNSILGDSFTPLGPYNFILCVEILARRLHQASNMGSKAIGVKSGHSRVNIPFLLHMIH